MTPAVRKARAAKIDFALHEYVHDKSENHYGEEAAEKMGVDARRVFKTLVVETDDGQLATAIVPVTTTLNLKSVARALGKKKAKMAEPARVEVVTGYVLGGVSPLGQKKQLTTILDTSATDFPTIFVSGGKRGLEIELAATDLITLTRSKTAAISN